MGSSQCNSINYETNNFTQLEHKLSFYDSTICKNLKNECSNLRYNLKTRRKSLTNNKTLIDLTVKVFVPEINPYKKKLNFSNWIQYIFHKSNSNKIEKRIENFDSNIKLIFENLYYENLNTFNDLLAKGPPKSIRCLVWKIAILKNFEFEKEKYEKEYDQYLNSETNKFIIKQIMNDVDRTFQLKEKPTEEKKKILFNVLKAYSTKDTELGYCQGMNFILKIILEVSQNNELDSFILFFHLMNKIRGFYLDNFPLLQRKIFIFEYYFKIKLPELFEHFKKLFLINELWISKWIQTLFTVICNNELILRIWDTIFAYGLNFIIPISISFLFFIEKDLLKFEDSTDVISYFKKCFCLNDYKGKHQFRNYIEIDRVIEMSKKIYSEMDNETMKKLRVEYNHKNLNLNSFSEIKNKEYYKKDNSFFSSRSSYSAKTSNFSSSNIKHSQIKKNLNEDFLISDFNSNENLLFQQNYSNNMRNIAILSENIIGFENDDK